MAISTLNLSGSMTGLPDGGPLTLAPGAWNNSAAPGPGGLFSVVSAGITVTVPAGKLGALISFPAGNSTPVTLKGVTGDTGVSIGPAAACAISLAATQSTIFLVAASTVNVNIDWL